MKYIVEFYPEKGVHPSVSDEDVLLQCKAETPFPLLEVGDPVALLTTKFHARTTINKDYWVVRLRRFIYWDEGCTVQYWCVPEDAGSSGKPAKK